MTFRTPRREVVSRPTEGAKSVATNHKGNEIRSERKRGRPTGSKNKPKALIPKELASDFLGVIKDMLPPEYYADMRDAIRNGKNISTISEAKILLKLMGPPVWLRLIEESRPIQEPPSDFDDDLADEIGYEPQSKVRPFDKDLNERLKVMLQIMQFISKIESEEDESDSSQKPILEIIARRGINSERVKFLVGIESGDVGGNTDGTGRVSIGARTVSGEVPERQIDVSDSQQE